MDKATDFFDTWLKTQEKLRENLMESAKKMQQAFLGAAGGGPGTGFFDLYNSWAEAAYDALNRTKEGADVLKETLTRTFSSSNAYTRLFDIWFPLLKAFQDKTFPVDSYKDLFDPAKYKEVMDKVFGFGPAAADELYSGAVTLMETWAGAVQGFMKPWTEALQESMKVTPRIFEGHPESFMNIFHNMFSAFDSTVGRIFHVPAVGKDREKIELILRGIDDLSVFMARNTEYQHMMYLTGLSAMEKVMETVAGKVKGGEQIKSFDEFFDLWIDVNEKTFYRLFQTPEFSKMQGELLEASLNVRKHFFKLMELYLYDFPIALRSEMDDLYKTIYDLRKKVKGLEKRLENASSEEVRA